MDAPPKSPLSLKDVKSSGENRPLENRVRSLKIDKTDRAATQNSGGRYGWIVAMLFACLCGALIYRDNGMMAAIGLRQPAPVVATPAAEPKDSKPKKKNAAKTTTKSTLDKNAVALESRGYVIARHQVLVSPQVSGRLLRLNIEEGRRVVKGDVLAEVDTTEYLADFNQLRGAMLKAKAELLELETGARPQEVKASEAELKEQEEILPQFQSEYERLKDLVKSNAISATEFEQAQSNYFGARRRIERLKQNLDMLREGPRKERVEMARASLVQTEASLAKAQWRLDNCVIRAPISGTILKKNAEEGNLVNPVAFNGSFSICDIADLSDLEIDLNIQERDIAKVFVGQRCEVKPEAFPKRYEAVVSRLMPIADRAKGAVPVRVAVRVPEEEQGVYLKPEMSAVVVFFGAQESSDATKEKPTSSQEKEENKNAPQSAEQPANDASHSSDSASQSTSPSDSK